MHPDERELIRLQVLLMLWPSRGRDEFKTELRLKQALQEAYDNEYPPPEVFVTCPNCHGAGYTTNRDAPKDLQRTCCLVCVGQKKIRKTED